MMAEAAAADGTPVFALDVFGDADTRRAASGWWPIGAASGLRIEPARFLAALQTLAQRGEADGWIAGSGFEAMPELLEQGARLLPLIGTAPDAVRRIRMPESFFGFLDAHAIAHPAVSHRAPAGPGWLRKNAQGTGGWHIRRASLPLGAAPPPHHYHQREARGLPMSATFVANGCDMQLLGFNALIVRPIAASPFVYCGAIGPVPMTPTAEQRLNHALRAITNEFALKGLCSLDFLLDGETVSVLEVNPRPSASMALYRSHGVMRMHLDACLDEVLPAAQPMPGELSGTEIAFARRPLVVSPSQAAQLAASPTCHDLPCPGTRYRAGDPVCSVSAMGAGTAQVRGYLKQRREAVLDHLETSS